MRSPEPTAAALRRLQIERIRRYRVDAGAAWTTDRGWTAATGGHAADAMHTAVELGTRHTTRIPIAVHENVGGWHDHAVPGDVLCAALACCADSTLRVAAARLGIQLEALAVTVEADVDVRGTLCVTPEVPVGFQRMRLDIDLRPAAGSDPARVAALRAAGEHCCVVLATLRSGVPIDVTYRSAQPTPEPERNDTCP